MKYALILILVMLAACGDDGDLDRYRSQFGESDNSMEKLEFRVGGRHYLVHVGKPGSEAQLEFEGDPDVEFRSVSEEWLLTTEEFQERGNYRASLDNDTVRIVYSVIYNGQKASIGSYSVAGRLFVGGETHYFVTLVPHEELTRLPSLCAAIRERVASRQ